MQATSQEPLIAPLELWKLLPANIAQMHFVEQSRKQIVQILNSHDKRLLLILGPCSIHDAKSAIHYAKKLKELTPEIYDVFLPVMRFHFEKPRTAGGWKGLLYDPFLDDSCDLNAGIKLTRSLLLELAALGVPAAAEILDPMAGLFFGDLLSWGCIGARTSASQVHRQIASGLPMPIGFKNTTDGNVDVAIQAILCARTAHSYLGANEMGQSCVIRTSGNPLTRLVLRGGEGKPNYDASSVGEVLQKLQKAGLEPSLFIDCAHDNSDKDPLKQADVFEQVIEQAASGNRSIRGILLESHLRAGKQSIPAHPNLLKYGISITDACIDWETTEGILFAAKKALSSHPIETRNASHYAFV